MGLRNHWNHYLRISYTGSPIEIATAGQTIGHAATAKSICVAASDATIPFPGPFTNASLVENSSSDGPHKMFYNPDGTAITPGNLLASGGVTLQTPALTAGDGGATSVPGFAQFYGTSAAAPAAAALSALVWSRNLSRTNTRIRTIAETSCLDIEAAGFENNSGNGILMADLALNQTQALVPTSVVSRKVHGGAGAFDINLPSTGNPGIECRSGGATNAYQVVFTFAGSVTLASASITTGTGSVASATGSGTTTLTVDVTGVTSGQTITVTLNSLSNGPDTVNLPARMGVLVGDTNGSGSVTSADIAQTKSAAGLTTNSSNFRTDINATGAINAADIGLVKVNSGAVLP